MNKKIVFNFTDFNLDKKNDEQVVLEDYAEEGKKENIENEKTPTKNDLFSLGEEIEETIKIKDNITYQSPKKAFEGANREVLESNNEDDVNAPIGMSSSGLIKDAKPELFDIKIPVKNSIEHIVENEINKEKEILKEKVIEPEFEQVMSRPAKIICVGGNESYFKSTLVNLKNLYPDVDFIKYIYGGGKSTLYTIDTMKPDIILIYHKAQIQNALQFYQTICNEVDDKGIPYKDKYIDKRIIVIAPNDLAYEMQMRSNGIEFFVNETNSKTHELDIEKLISQIRLAVADINEKKTIREDLLLKKQQKIEDVIPLNLDSENENIPEEFVPEEPSNDHYIEEKQHSSQVQKTGMIQPVANSRNNTNLPDSTTGKIIGVYSATGGAGKTTFATNLSAILSKYSNLNNPNSYKVALVEYNFACQNIDLFFNIKTDKNICGLAQDSLDYIDENNNIPQTTMETLIRKHMYHDEESNLDILLGISVPLEIDKVSSKFTNTLFDSLKQMYDIVIVDLSTDIAKPQILNAFNKCDDLYYIMPMDVTSIRNTKVMINFFTGSIFRMPADRIKVILNKVNINNKEFGVDQVYAALASTECVPEGTIPDAGDDVLSSINRGIPIAIENLENPVSQAIYSIAVGVNPMLNDSLILGETTKEKKKGILGNIFGKKEKTKKEKFKNEEPKKTKKSLFGKKKNEPSQIPVKLINNSLTKEEKPIIEKKSIFGKKKIDNKPKEFVPVPFNEPIQEKQGFFGKLFGGKNKKDELNVNVKTKKKGLGGFLNKKKTEEIIEQDIAVTVNPQNSRLKTLVPRQPLKKE